MFDGRVKVTLFTFNQKEFFCVKMGTFKHSVKFQYVNKEIVLVFANFTSRNLVLMITILTR